MGPLLYVNHKESCSTICLRLTTLTTLRSAHGANFLPTHPPIPLEVILGEAGDKNLSGDSRKSVPHSLLIHNFMGTGTLNGPQLVVNCITLYLGDLIQ